MPRKEKENPKWKEENITARCKYCDKLYIANKMLDKGFKMVFPVSVSHWETCDKTLCGDLGHPSLPAHEKRTYVGSNQFFYFCNEKCLDAWKIANPDRIPKPEGEGMIKIEEPPKN